MSKYNRITDPIEKAKNTINIVAGIEAHDESILKQNAMYKKYNDSVSKDLLQFGIELYENGYSLSDVSLDMELCVAMRNTDSSYDSKTSMFSYNGIKNPPSYKKMLEIADNPNLLMNIENGYNIAYRRALANSIIAEKKNKR